MRFNPKASINKSRVRDSSSSGGGGGRGGTGGGLGGALGGGRGGGSLPLPGGAKGGVGILVLVVVFFVITQCSGGGLSGITGGSDPQSSQNGSGTDRYQQCVNGADANTSSDCARLLIENSLVDYWETALPEQSDVAFRAASLQTFTGNVGTGCGGASSAMGPFYCPSDQTIYLDSTFFPDVLEGQLGGKGGDFVEPYVIGHEYGHHVQNLMGTMNRVRTQKGPKSDAVRLELQADCYAGMWTRSASQTTDTDGQVIFEDLAASDIDEAMDAAQTVGDDRIQKKSGGRVDPEGWTHGSAAQRQRWFQVGLDQGSLAACDTFAATNL